MRMFVALIIFCACLNADEPLVVKLETECTLIPICVHHIQNEKAAFSEDYLDVLSKVLLFDIGNGGHLRTMKDKAHLNLTASVTGNKLHAQLNTKSIEFELSGKLEKDRALIHQLSDRIHKELIGVDGIAKTKILYTERQKLAGKNEWTSDVWEMDYDGANKHLVMGNAGYVVTPQYAPAAPGHRPGSFVYVSYKNGIPKIYAATLKEGFGRRVTELKGNQLMPTFNHNKDTIAFISDVAGNPDLFIMNLSENKPRQVFSTKWATQGTPAFSPCGKKIAFVSNKDGSPRIYSVDISKPWVLSTDLTPKLITKFRRGCTAPSWSPDAKKIAYTAPQDGFQQIFVYDLEKDAETQLTKGSGNKENPSWAPNSVHLVFNLNQEGTSDICLINLNQKVVTKVTSGGSEKRFPSWEPFSG